MWNPCGVRVEIRVESEIVALIPRAAIASTSVRSTSAKFAPYKQDFFASHKGLIPEVHAILESICRMICQEV